MIQCSNCGQEWPRDPALEVECPTCRAKPGVLCRRPSEHECPVHATRDRLAMESVPGYGRCPAGKTVRTPQQANLFGSAQ